MEYKFSQKVNQEDFLVFYQFHLLSIFKRPMNALLLVILFGFLIVAPIIQQEYTQLYYALGMILFVGLLYIYLKRSGIKMYNRSKDSLDMDYILNDTGLSFNNVDGASKKVWSEFYTLFENRKYIFLFLKNRRGLLFIKNQMEPEVITYLVENATKNMRPRNILIKK